jgi:PPM family protein phosphatase
MTLNPTPVHIRAFGRTDVGRVRRNNEDAFVIADLMSGPPAQSVASPTEFDLGERGALLAVSDGVGGEQAGEVASALALDSLGREMSRGSASDAEIALEESVQVANQRVLDAAHSARRRGMGTTLTAVLIHDHHAYVAEVGDSRAYLVRGHRAVQLTHDQSYVQLLLDAGAVTELQAETHEYRNVILQALGTQSKVIVALTRLSLCRDDRLVLCSDGLTAKVQDEEMRHVVSCATTPRAATDDLVAMANQRGGEDNITVVVAALEGQGLPAPTGEAISLETLQAFPRLNPGVVADAKADWPKGRES